MKSKAKKLLNNRLRESTMKGLFIEIISIASVVILMCARGEIENVDKLLAACILISAINLISMIKTNVRASIAIDSGNFSIKKHTCEDKSVKYHRRHSDNFINYKGEDGEDKRVSCKDETYSKIDKGDDITILHRNFGMYLEHDKDYLLD